MQINAKMEKMEGNNFITPGGSHLSENPPVVSTTAGARILEAPTPITPNTTATVARLAVAADNATSNPFAKCKKMLRSPTKAPHSAPPTTRAEVSILVNEDARDTPKRNRELTSPNASPRQTPPKRQKGQEPSPSAQLAELGAILDDLLYMITEKKPAVRHINTGMKSSLQRMKEIQANVSEHLRSLEKIEEGKKGKTGKALQLTPANGSSQSSNTGTQTSPKREKRRPPPQKKRETAPPAVKAVEAADPTNRIPEDEGWKKVKKKKVKNRPRRQLDRPHRPDALLVKCKDAASYAQVVKTVHTDDSLQQYRESVIGLRRTAPGEVLLRMQKHCDENTYKLLVAVKAKIGEFAEVKAMSDKVALEIRDIPEWCSRTDVLEAVFAKIDSDIPADATPKLRAAYRGTQTASIVLPKPLADQLLSVQKLRIGWAVCRIRLRIEPRRCFKCLDFGHIAARCRSRHNSAGRCFNCGGADHASKDCNKKAECILCTRLGEKQAAHNTLSRGCPQYVKAAKSLQN